MLSKPFPEPAFSRPLLFGLLAVITLAHFAWQGLGRGAVAGPQSLTLPLLHALQVGSAHGDPLALLIPHWISPLWWLIAHLDSRPEATIGLLAALTVVTRAAGAAAVFRLCERAFAYPLAAMLAAILWLGAGSVGGIALHPVFFSAAELCSVVLLWSLVLWQEGYPRWALLSALATCIDVPLGALWFGLFWLLGWWGAVSVGPEGAARLHTYRRRLQAQLRAVVWYGLGITPWLLLAPAALQGGWTGFMAWLAARADVMGSIAVAAPAGGCTLLWVLLAVGAWCWRRAPVPRNSGSGNGSAGSQARALGAAVWVCAVLVGLGSWLVSVGAAEVPLLAAARAAPTVAALCLVGIARVMERNAARRGGCGFALLWLWVWLALLFDAAWQLAGGVVLLELLYRAARRLHRDPRRALDDAVGKVLPGGLRRERRALRRDAARWALAAFVLALLWRGHSAALGRLAQGDALSVPPGSALRAAGKWAQRHTPPDALFLAGAPGFRQVADRALFLDQGDAQWCATSPTFERLWLSRIGLATALWNHTRSLDSLAQRLRAHGVTHLVVAVHRRLSPAKARLLYRNRNWAIYRLR